MCCPKNHTHFNIRNLNIRQFITQIQRRLIVPHQIMRRLIARNEIGETKMRETKYATIKYAE